MAQLISSSTSIYHLFALFLVILVCLSNHQTSANRLSSQLNSQQNPLIYNDQSSEDFDESESPVLFSYNDLYIPDNNEEIIKQNPWSQLFRRHYERSVYMPTQRSDFALRRGEIHYNPYFAHKRAIPIELQKALFAHGIVGRRR